MAEQWQFTRFTFDLLNFFLDKRTSRVFLEITMCYHIFQGLKDYIEQAKENDWKKPLYLYEDRCSIANYR